MTKTYYDLLNIQQTASKEEIKSAYRRLCFIYHPDRCTSSFKSHYEEKLKKINQAYSVLSDTELKADYDKRLHAEIHKTHTYTPEPTQPKNRPNYKNSAHEFVCDIYNTIKNEKNRKRKFFLIAGLLCVLAQPLYGVSMLIYSFFETKQTLLNHVRQEVYQDLDHQFKRQFNTLTHTGE